MQENGLRLIDFFKQFDRDQSMTLTREEFRNGCKVGVSNPVYPWP